MADVKISDLTILTSIAVDDELVVVDKSDTTSGAAGTTKKITQANLLADALLDSEVDANIKTLALPASTTISTFGASLVDDAAAVNARSTLDVDQAGTDNSTDVTLNASATTGGMSLSTQEISNQAATNAQNGYMTSTLVGNIETNNGKVTNATHTGEVTGSGALTVDKVAISNKSVVTALGTDYVLISDTSDTGNLKKALISDFASAGGDMAAATYDPTNIAGDAFAMDNMVEGTTTKILTATERSAITTNSAKISNVSTNLSEGTATATTVDVNSSDGTNATLVSASTSRAGLLTKAKFDEIVANTAKVTNATHSGDATGDTALTLATVNSNVGSFTNADITVNAKGLITACANGSGSGISWSTPVDADIVPDTDVSYDLGSTTKRMDYVHTRYLTGADTTDRVDLSTAGSINIITNSSERLSINDSGMLLGASGARVTTVLDTDAMTEDSATALATQQSIKAYVDNSDDTSKVDISGDTMTGALIAADHGTATTDQVVNVCYGTSATPPTASTTTEGTLYIQYTA